MIILNSKKENNEEWKIPLYKIYSDDEDLNLITKIIKRGTKWAIGPEIEQFENELASFVGKKFCVALNSGTSGLHAALQAYGIGTDDEVIVPSFSFISTANSVLFVNGTPVFSDIETENYGLDATLLDEKISKKTLVYITMNIRKKL